MQQPSNLHFAPILRNCIYSLNDELIELKSVSDNVEYTKYLAINRILLSAKRTLTDAITHTSTPYQNLRFYELEKSTLDASVLNITKSGLLSLHPKFFDLSHFIPGLKFKPAFNTEEPGQKSIFFLEQPTGFTIQKNGINIKPILTFLKKPFPSKVLWDLVNYDGQRGFQIRFQQ